MQIAVRSIHLQVRAIDYEECTEHFICFSTGSIKSLNVMGAVRASCFCCDVCRGILANNVKIHISAIHVNTELIPVAITFIGPVIAIICSAPSI